MPRSTYQAAPVRLPEAVEAFRDHAWRRDEQRRVESIREAENFVEERGFACVFGDCRLPCASLYVAVCARRDAHLPRLPRTDEEWLATAELRDQIVRRGQIFYGRVRGARALLIAMRLLPHFYRLYGVPDDDAARILSPQAQTILALLRDEREMASTDLARAAKIKDYSRCALALVELQRCMKVVVSDFVAPRRTQVWMPMELRFGEALRREVGEEEALGEIARAYLRGAGTTLPGELARATGLSRRLAGRGNHLLVREGFAERIKRGVYRLAEKDGEASACGVHI